MDSRFFKLCARANRNEGFNVPRVLRSFSTNSPGSVNSSTVRNSRTVVLNSGYELPMIGLGTFTGTRFTQKYEKGMMQDAVMRWLQHGGTSIDAAQNYLNEDEIGNAIESALERNYLSREELFLSSKLNNPYHRKEDVRIALEKSLIDLKVDYLDLYLMHWPTPFVYVGMDKHLGSRGFPQYYEPDQCSVVTGKTWDETHWGRQTTNSKQRSSNPNNVYFPPHLQRGITIHETWNAMVECQKEGLVKSIGVCNFQVQLLNELVMNTDVIPAVVQVESHPFLQQWGLLKYCERLGIQMQSYSPLGYGEFRKTDEIWPLSDPNISKIAKKHEKSSAQVCLRWSIQRGVCTNALTLKNSEMAENLDIFDFELDDEDFDLMNTLDKNYHYLRPDDWYGLPLWD